MNVTKNKTEQPTDSEVAGYDEGHIVEFAGDDAAVGPQQPEVKDLPDASAGQPSG